MKLEPKNYYIKEHLVEPKNNIEAIELTSSIEPEKNVGHIQHIIVDEWDTEISIFIAKDLTV